MTDRTETELMAELAARTRALPRDIDPPANAWPAIYAEIKRPPMKAPLSHGLVGARVWHRPVFLAAAGLLLAAGSSLVTVVALRQERYYCQ